MIPKNKNLVKIMKENDECREWMIRNKTYEECLEILCTKPFTQEEVDYLCKKIDDPKHKNDPEVRCYHLRPFLLNPTTTNFDLKEFFLVRFKKSRRLWLKMYYIMGYAKFATEEELIPVIDKFNDNMRSIHDYIDFSYLMSKYGIKLLVRTYNYPCLHNCLKVAKQEYRKIDPLLKGYITTDKNFKTIELLPNKVSKLLFELALKRKKPYVNWREKIKKYFKK